MSLACSAGRVVDAARRIEGDDQVLVEHDRVCAGQGRGAAEGRGRRPWRRPRKGLARRGGEGGFDRPIVDAEDRQPLPGVGAPHHGELFAGEAAGDGFGRGGEGAGSGGVLSSSGELAGSDLLGSRRPESLICEPGSMTIDNL
jgi:hypothetical protein